MIRDRKKFYERILYRDYVGSEPNLKIELTKKLISHSVDTIEKLPNELKLFRPYPFNKIYKQPLLIFNKNGIHTTIRKAEGWKLKKVRISIKWTEIICTYFRTEWRREDARDRKTEYFIIDIISKNSAYKLPPKWHMNKSLAGHYIEMFKEKYSVSQDSL